MVFSKLRLVVGVFIVSTGLVIAASGGAVAAADPETTDSTSDTASDTSTPSDTSTDAETSPETPVESPIVVATTVTPTPAASPEPPRYRLIRFRLGSGRTPGEGAAPGATRWRMLSEWRDRVAENSKHNSGEIPVLTPSDVAESISNVIAPVRKAITAAPGLLAPATDAVADIPHSIAPLTDAIASVPGLPKPLKDVVAAVPDLVAPVTDVISMLPVLIAYGSDVALATVQKVLVAAAVPLTKLQSKLLSWYGVPRTVVNTSPGALVALPLTTDKAAHAMPQESPSLAPVSSAPPSSTKARTGIAELMGYETPLHRDSSQPEPAAAAPDAGSTAGLSRVAEVLGQVVIAVSLAALALAALPGVGGLVVSTSAGVHLGYRQAKAGTRLQSPNIARFARSGPLGVVRSGSIVEIRSKRLRAERQLDRVA